MEDDVTQTPLVAAAVTRVSGVQIRVSPGHLVMADGLHRSRRRSVPGREAAVGSARQRAIRVFRKRFGYARFDALLRRT